MKIYTCSRTHICCGDLKYSRKYNRHICNGDSEYICGSRRALIICRCGHVDAFYRGVKDISEYKCFECGTVNSCRYLDSDIDGDWREDGCI